MEQKNAVVVSCTCQAPSNIAVIKYWGKRDENLILPLNSSLSGTLHMDSLCSTTTVEASASFERDEMWLGGKEQSFTSKRLTNCITALRSRAQDLIVDGKVVVSKEDWPKFRLRITSANNFPTAAGLASSASGFACLTKCLAELFGVTDSLDELSSIARQGSGSACRSLHGGWVKWQMGVEDDGSDSLAKQVAPAAEDDEASWPDMRIIILVASAEKKKVSSSSGMQTSVVTSKLLDFRAKNVVEERMEQMEAAIKAKDFETFAELTMKDSNQFHATCLDTYPPIFYMNDVSRKVVYRVHEINADGVKVAYTFDAGPNAVLYTLKDNVPTVLDAIFSEFSVADNSNDAGDDFKLKIIEDKLELVSVDALSSVPQYDANPQIERIIVTKVGRGAKITKAREVKTL